MSHNISPQDNACLGDELGPELRDAVDAVIHDEPPTDWVSETLERLRNQQFQATPRKTSRRAKVIALAAVAASLVLVVQFERLGMFEDVKQLVSNVFTGPEIPEDGNPEDGNPEDWQGPVDEPPKPPIEVVVPDDPDTILPTLWAYQQAVRQSPEALEALLDEHADQVLPASSDLELAEIWQELL